MGNSKGDLSNNNGSFIFYNSADGQQKIEAYFKDETVWLTQKKMAELYGVGVQAVIKHLGNIYTDEELSKDATCSILEQVQQEGNRLVKRRLEYYNLDAILSVGYRVNSRKAIDFRKWATAVLREYLIKGFALDDERLKNGSHFGKDYFDELLERIREIRLSERRLHQKLTDILMLSSDYSKDSPLTKEFYAFIQNKLHYAITGKTAAEIIRTRADKNKKHMGLTSWKQSPKGKILKSDVTVAKNYLSKDELSDLARAVSAFLDIAESRAKKQQITTTEQWLEIMNGYLDLSGYPKLMGAGKIKKADADSFAITEYQEFRIKQDQEYLNDFDEEVKRLAAEEE